MVLYTLTERYSLLHFIKENRLRLIHFCVPFEKEGEVGEPVCTNFDQFVHVHI